MLSDLLRCGVGSRCCCVAGRCTLHSRTRPCRLTGPGSHATACGHTCACLVASSYILRDGSFLSQWLSGPLFDTSRAHARGSVRGPNAPRPAPTGSARSRWPARAIQVSAYTSSLSTYAHAACAPPEPACLSIHPRSAPPATGSAVCRAWVCARVWYGPGRTARRDRDALRYVCAALQSCSL